MFILPLKSYFGICEDPPAAGCGSRVGDKRTALSLCFGVKLLSLVGPTLIIMLKFTHKSDGKFDFNYLLHVENA